MIKILGFCASPRLGNSLYLLDTALEAARKAAEDLGQAAETDRATVRGKKLQGCVMCQACMRDGTCAIKDDFAELQAKWLWADVILYSVPVYHMGMPAQMKAFVDRLGNSMFGRYKKLFGEAVSTTGKPLKVVGCITQGIHAFSGQEHTITQVINHAMISGCVPVAGDMWESYIGAAGWTCNAEARSAMQTLAEGGAEDGRVAVRAAQTLAANALEMALLLQKGGQQLPKLCQKPNYTAFAQRLAEEEG